MEITQADTKLSQENSPRALIICVYLGDLPEFVHTWAASCATNSQNFDWLLVVDRPVPEHFNLPPNVVVQRLTLQDMSKRVEALIGFPPAMTTPYKLCDAKPLYGQIFAQELQPYAYWGHCDLDMYYGDLSEYALPHMREGFDRIFERGPLTLYANKPHLNEMWMDTRWAHLGHGPDYRKVFKDPGSCVFDETQMMSIIAQQQGIRQHTEITFADIYPAPYRFQLNKREDKLHQVLGFWRGQALRVGYWEADKNPSVDTLAFVHDQKRGHMPPKASVADAEAGWLLTPAGWQTPYPFKDQAAIDPEYLKQLAS